MNFSNRQLKILAFIINNKDGVVGYRIANRFSISLRTVQQEIKNINSILPSTEQIISVGKKGYSCQNISDTNRKEISNLISANVSLRVPIKRVSTISSILYFENDYLSMEKLAEKLFISKTTVFNIFSESYVLQKEAKISKTKGIICTLDEIERRDELSKIFRLEDSDFIDSELLKDYTTIDKILDRLLPNLLINNDYIVSGEALWYFKRYLIFTLIRTKRNFLIENIQTSVPISPIVKTVTDDIRILTSFKVTENDLIYCSLKLDELNSYVISNEEYFINKISIFKNKLKDIFNIDWDIDDTCELQFATHLANLYKRIKNKHYNYNSYKREINRKMPMCTHIALELFESTFGFRIADTELAFVALYIFRGITNKYEKINCVLVSDFSPSITYSIHERIISEFSNYIDEAIIRPYYFYKQYDYDESDLILTTIESFAIENNNAILIQPILSSSSKEQIIKKAISNINSNKEAIINKTKVKYLSEYSINNIDDELDFFVKTKEQKPDSWYEFVMDKPIMLYPTFDSSKKSFIHAYSLEEPFGIRGHAIKTVIVSNYNRNDDDIISFYNVIDNIINNIRS